MGNNMYAYGLNNPINLVDPSGCRPSNQFSYTCHDGSPARPANLEYLMVFYGVDSPDEIPEIPDGAMIFVENITSVTIKNGICFIEGTTVVMDEFKYCEYFFTGVGWGISMSMPLDGTISQGYVYGIENVEDYCGRFYGFSANMLSDIYGGAYASPTVYAEIVGGMSYAPSVGVSITYYTTSQTEWIYGKANVEIYINPYQNNPYGPNGPVAI